MSSTDKHTPGPWMVRHGESNYQKHKLYIKRRDANLDSHMIATVSEEPKRDERHANANLMAAAPELKDALEDLIIIYTETLKPYALPKECQKRIESHIKNALAVLLKANGGT